MVYNRLCFGHASNAFFGFSYHPRIRAKSLLATLYSESTPQLNSFIQCAKLLLATFIPSILILPALIQVMTIKIYGNLTMSGNSSITTTRCSQSRPSRAQTVARARRSTSPPHIQPVVEDVAIEDLAPENVPILDHAVGNHAVENHAIDHHAIENHAIEQHAVENHAIEHHAVENHANEHHAVEPVAVDALRQRRGQLALLGQGPRRNAPLPRRRSSRIARRANLSNALLHPRRRRPLPSAHEDHDFWAKIWTLPTNLLRYLSPGWHPLWTTRGLFRQIIWHFKPNQRIPCRTLKVDLIELFEVHVAQQYGAYYGI
ncbi:uncharacterized protein MELLADRAFT_95813 [Melampsora larici-populina 98AG31]|uniref:Uncharacterized protein n=1 Tax=Melampsora larici-populina (strain 98AG31 / pathotype 3-4-7) TaxID=747676 RepID=F4RDB2_MELLP|nr:uncharacterized protein MELLADRAFT_95813 [Melampsora larici-populina 98AG31]EGG09370.1 hypothetical protein MELLADRAFT_95813 [Melampsora larici-populina 98AG31]